MTLSNYSNSSSDMFLSPSSISSTPLSDISSTSFLSSPQPQPKGKRPQKLDRKHKTRSSRSSTYKHIPHRLKPPHLVAKRNARERKRVQAVNYAFSRLRKHVPFEPRHRRLSKVKTLRFAIKYIQHLQELITNHDRQTSEEHHVQVQGMYKHFNHHYYHHHHEHRHLVRNKSVAHETSHADVTHQRRTISNKPPQVSPGKESIYIHLRNATSNLPLNTDKQCVGLFSQSSCISSSPSYSPEPVKDNFSTIHNLPPCFRNSIATDCALSHPLQACLSLTDHPLSAPPDNNSLYATEPHEPQEMMTYEQQTSHFAPFRQSFLNQDTPTPRDCLNVLSSHFETVPSALPTSVDACSRSNIGSTTLSADALSYMQRILRPASNHLFPQVNMSGDCPDYTPQFRMFQMYSNRMKTVINDCPLATRPQQLINTDQDLSFTDSQFDHEMAPLDDYRIYP